jgi:hypothetical protein
MKLKNCTHGRLVINREGCIGMIVGITNNCEAADCNVRSEPDRAIPLVQWANGRTIGTHPITIELLK